MTKPNSPQPAEALKPCKHVSFTQPKQAVGKTYTRECHDCGKKEYGSEYMIISWEDYPHSPAEERKN